MYRPTTNLPLTFVPIRYPQRTIFEDLDDAGVSFGIYYQNIPATLFYRDLRKLKYSGKFHPYGLSFKNDAMKGKLPGYVVVEQRYMDTKEEPANDDHPSHDVYQVRMMIGVILFFIFLVFKYKYKISQKIISYKRLYNKKLYYLRNTTITYVILKF